MGPVSCLQRSEHKAGQPGLGLRPQRGWRQGSTGGEGGTRGSARRAGQHRVAFSQKPPPLSCPAKAQGPRRCSRGLWAAAVPPPPSPRGHKDGAQAVAAWTHTSHCPPARQRVKPRQPSASSIHGRDKSCCSSAAQSCAGQVPPWRGCL